jgi:hypothetical protein
VIADNADIAESAESAESAERRTPNAKRFPVPTHERRYLVY